MMLLFGKVMVCSAPADTNHGMEGEVDVVVVGVDLVVGRVDLVVGGVDKE